MQRLWNKILRLFGRLLINTTMCFILSWHSTGCERRIYGVLTYAPACVWAQSALKLSGAEVRFEDTLTRSHTRGDSRRHWPCPLLHRRDWCLNETALHPRVSGWSWSVVVVPHTLTNTMWPCWIRDCLIRGGFGSLPFNDPRKRDFNMGKLQSKHGETWCSSERI